MYISAPAIDALTTLADDAALPSFLIAGRGRDIEKTNCLGRVLISASSMLNAHKIYLQVKVIGEHHAIIFRT